MTFISKRVRTLMHRLTRFHKSQLLVSNTLSTMGLCGLGDLLAQYIEIKLTIKKKSLSDSLTAWDKKEHSFFKRYDPTRTGIITGPFGHYWYLMLDKKFPARNLANIGKMCAYDQLIAAPIFTLLVVTVIHTLDGKHIRQVMNIFKEKFLIIYAYDCSFWPLAQFINFYFVPAVYRLLYVNILSVLWNSLLSYLLFDEVD